MRSMYLVIGSLIMWVAWMTPAHSSIPTQEVINEIISAKLRTHLERYYPGASIEVSNEYRMVRGEIPSNVEKVSLILDHANGHISFSVTGDESVAEGSTSFKAMVPAWISVKRIGPGEPLKPEYFVKREIDVSSGMAREYRSLLLPIGTSFDRLESRQTILEGQFAVTSAIQKAPDIRRGEMVRVQIKSGTIILSTQALADEPAYVDGPVKVTTLKTKRQLSGKLLKDAVVEVKL